MGWRGPGQSWWWPDLPGGLQDLRGLGGCGGPGTAGVSWVTKTVTVTGKGLKSRWAQLALGMWALGGLRMCRSRATLTRWPWRMEEVSVQAEPVQ